MTDYTHDFEIGTDIGSMTNYQALTTPVPFPKTAFHIFAGTIDLDDLTARGVGLPSIVQSWAVITQAARDALRIYCPGASAPVVIRSRTNDNSSEFLYFTCQMIWPSLSEEYDAAHRLSFSITFRNCVVTSPPS